MYGYLEPNIRLLFQESDSDNKNPLKHRDQFGL